MIYPAIFRNGTWEADNLTWEGFGNSAELNFFAFFPARTYMETIQELTLPTRPEHRGANTPPPTCFMPPPSHRVESDGAVPLDFRHVMYRLTVSPQPFRHARHVDAGGCE